MGLAPDLLSLLEGTSLPSSPLDYFTTAQLEILFHNKIAKSQATGKDGVRVGFFAEDLHAQSEIIARKVRQQSYNFTTYKERLLLRGAKRNPRQISIPTVRDRLVLRALCQVLHDDIPRSTGTSPHALVKKVSDAINQQPDDLAFVRVDVRDFFPSVLHKRLEKELIAHNLDPVMRWLCMAAVKTPTGESGGENLRGIPQGLSISGALSSIYMLRFDDVHTSRGIQYFRYVDDILLIVPAERAELELRRISKSLNDRGLRAHRLGTDGKTEISPVQNGIDFLGYHICVGKVSIRQSSYKRMFRNILKVITDYRYRKNVQRTLFRLNLKISGCLVDNKRRGWMMFFSQTDDMSQLKFLDIFVRKQLARVGFPQEFLNDVKSFIKSRHEIRYNLSVTGYIPNFDNYTLEQRTEVISILSGKSIEVVMSWDASSIESQFNRLLSKEVQDLEQDVGNLS